MAKQARWLYTELYSLHFGTLLQEAGELLQVLATVFEEYGLDWAQIRDDEVLL